MDATSPPRPSRVKRPPPNSSDGPGLNGIQTSNVLMRTTHGLSLRPLSRSPAFSQRKPGVAKNPASPNEKFVLTMSREQPGVENADSNGVTKVVRTLLAINSAYYF